jgi:hypothetical protein
MRWCVVISGLFWGPAALPASDPPRVLIACGHPGDAEHAALYARTVARLREIFTSPLGFGASDVTVLFGGEEHINTRELGELAVAPATAEEFRTAVQALAERLQAEDSCWVILLGHAHFEGRRVDWNLPGPDLTDQTLTEVLRPLRCRQQIVWITTPVSGYFLKPLARPGRIVISATEADREINETIMPHVLADILTEPPSNFDQDGDGVRTLLDLYLTVAQVTAQRYLTDMTLCTEHAQLDDNFDGRGSEVQLDYLSPELGGRRQESRPLPPTETKEGSHSRTILLPEALFVPPPPVSALEPLNVE